jgi:hypothetical protein
MGMAELLTQWEWWKLILSATFRQFLGGKIIGNTGRPGGLAIHCARGGLAIRRRFPTFFNLPHKAAGGVFGFSPWRCAAVGRRCGRRVEF